MSNRIGEERDAVHAYLERLRSMDPDETLTRIIDEVEREYDESHPAHNGSRPPMGFRKPTS